MFMIPVLGWRMLRLPEMTIGLLDDCYDAATNASDYAGSVSGLRRLDVGTQGRT